MAHAVSVSIQRRSRRARLAVLLTSVGVLAATTMLTNADGAQGAATGPTATASCVAKVDPSLLTSGRSADVIVIGRTGDHGGAAAAVAAAGGRVRSDLSIVNGVRASVPAGRLVELGCSQTVTSVTPNSAVQFQGRHDQDGPSTASEFVREAGVLPLWRQGDDGTGVGVAVIDTGVSPMHDLSGRIVNGPDLSGEGTIIDSYGHGTVMAGIIGGDGTDSKNAAAGPRTGVAPGATLIAVKVAGRNGATDVSTVLQAMHWVSAYQDEFNIRVLNLSWGTPSTQSPTIDPLDYAVERLWRQGIVVVVAAGNAGPAGRTILKPADDPLVVTVGAYENNGSTDRPKYTVPDWSSAGPTAAGYPKPDLVASGRTLIAQRSYGSAVETDNPDALVAPSYIKGSGTSEAAAVASGSIAVLLQARPRLTPDQVKRILMQTASPIAKTAQNRQGAGRLSLAGTVDVPAGRAVTQTPVATGLGSIEASRGGRHVVVDCAENGTPNVIIGEIDVRCQRWRPALWTGASWTGASWTGASWTGASWTGASWTGGSWTGASWTGASWTGGSWTGASWTGASWTGASWTGGSWTGASWTGASWTGASWTADQWNSVGSGAFLTAWWGDVPSADLHIVGESTANTTGGAYGQRYPS